MEESQAHTIPEGEVLRIMDEAAARMGKPSQLAEQGYESRKHAREEDTVRRYETKASTSVARDGEQDEEATRGSKPHDNEDEELQAIVPESVQDALQPQSLRRTLHLSTQHSAPGDMETVLEPRPASGAISKVKAASFTQGSGGSNDTQPFTSQLVKSWVQEDESTIQYQADEEPKTTEKGDAGYVDLADKFVPSSPFHETQNEDETQNYDDLLKSPAQDASPEEMFKKPAMPQTPATHGLRRGESYTSGDTTAQTDRFADFDLGHQVGLMGQSQLFANTQAHSSPPPDGILSDPAITRPSPSIQTWSPRVGVSSPTDTRIVVPSRPTTAPGEPRGHYTSMEESQKRKALARKAAEARRTLDGNVAENDEDDFWDDSQAERRALRRTKSDEISHNLDRVRAPPSSFRLSSGRKSSKTIDLITPATTKREIHVDFTLDQETDEEDGLSDEVLSDEEDLPDGIVHEDEDNQASVDDNDNDQYDEFSQTIMRSQPGDHDEYEDGSVVSGVRVEDAEMADADEVDEVGNAEAAMPIDRGLNASTAEDSTIVDSQTLAKNEPKKTVLIAHAQQSSMASYIPGSQYQGRTSEEQAILASSQRRSQSCVAASQSDVQDSNAAKVPSSPPILHGESSVGNPSEGTPARRELRRQSHGQSALLQEESTDDREIPESDLPDLERPQTAPTPQVGSREETQDTNGAPYSTARTHVSGSARSPAKSVLAHSPLKMFLSQQSRVSGRSAGRPSAIRPFSEMPALKTANSSFENAVADMDDVMNNLISNEDRTVLGLSSDGPDQPPTKRRRLNRRSSSSNGSSSAQAATTPPTSHTRPDLELRDHFTASDPPDTIAESEPDFVHRETPVRALKDSPNKANEMPASQPPKEDDEIRESGTESQLLREKAGAHAVSQLVAARPQQVKKLKMATYGKTARRRLSKQSTTSKKKSLSRARTPDPMELDDLRAGDPESEAGQEVITADVAVTTSENQTLTVTAPKRVFALFRGQFNGFYTATWLGSSADGMSYKVRFDDGTTTNIDTMHVRSLQLKVGDSVKVDVKGMRTKSYMVVGFHTAAVIAPGINLETDVYGHTHVKVQVKGNRNSLSTTGADHGNDEVQEVPIGNVYLTHTLWTHFDRTFSVPGSAVQPRRPGTPSTRSETPASTTPGSRGRVNKPAARLKAEGRISNLREASVASSSSASASGIFSGMAFAVTYLGDDAEKTTVTRLIQRNGGTILADGFQELFDPTDMNLASPRKRSPKKGEAETPGLHIKTQHQDLSFVALIADRHSRRAKYMQALALGLPTISGRWILHSMDAVKNVTMNAPLAWDKYLLPAGESSYLGGAIRSRTLIPYHAHSSELERTIKTRPLLLNGETVFLGPPKKGKSGGGEKRQTYAFLTRALGAGEVKRVDDLSKAKSLLDEEPDHAKLVYVDGDVDEAYGILFGKPANGKKRKRASESVAAAAAEARLSVTHGNVKIVNDEFVVQSLILGALVD